jgi:hypothetical protein
VALVYVTTAVFAEPRHLQEPMISAKPDQKALTDRHRAMLKAVDDRPR